MGCGGDVLKLMVDGCRRETRRRRRADHSCWVHLLQLDRYILVTCEVQLTVVIDEVIDRTW